MQQQRHRASITVVKLLATVYHKVYTTMSQTRRFALVLAGATGFTGRLAARYLAEFYGGGLPWAIAGRNEAKLKVRCPPLRRAAGAVGGERFFARDYLKRTCNQLM